MFHVEILCRGHVVARATVTKLDVATTRLREGCDESEAITHTGYKLFRQSHPGFNNPVSVVHVWN